MSITKITKKDFETEVLKSEKSVLLDFYASWCGPCQMLSPIVEELANEHSEFNVFKVDVDQEGELATMFGIVSIPTLIAFKNGEVVGKIVGLTTKDQILSMMK